MEPLEKRRAKIGETLRDLRHERRWTQAALARRLGLSQSRLSQIEHGDRSLSAEQFLLALHIFNVGTSRFVEQPRDDDKILQNALARLGASHLQEDATILAPDELEDLHQIVRSALVSGAPRLVTALAPVVVSNIDRIGFPKLRAKLADVGFERRLDWLLDNVRRALEILLEDDPKSKSAKNRRRALVVLDAALDFRDSARPMDASAPLDVFDRGIRSKRTLAEVRASSSAISQRWRIVSSLQVDDFVAAMRAADGDD